MAQSWIGFQCEFIKISSFSLLSLCVASTYTLCSFRYNVGSVLIGYLIFAITDTIFHITPSQPYNEMLRDAIAGSGGEDACKSLMELMLNRMELAHAVKLHYARYNEP